jgi:hypothetical protein
MLRTCGFLFETDTERVVIRCLFVALSWAAAGRLWLREATHLNSKSRKVVNEEMVLDSLGWHLEIAITGEPRQ